MRRSKKVRRSTPRLLLLVALVATLFILPILSPQANAGGRGKVILISVDQVSLRELKETTLPQIQSLIEKGGVGAMNVRLPAQQSLSSGYTTIGAGSKAVGVGEGGASPYKSKEIWEGFGVKEEIGGRPAGDIFFERTGLHVNPPTIVNLSINQIMQANSDDALGTKPGLLGEVLHLNGLKTAVIGNSDTNTDYGRSAIDTVMDERGRCDFGNVGRDLLREDPSFPTGLRTNEANLLKAFKDTYAEADVIMVDLGDTARVESEAAYLSPYLTVKYKREALRGADRFITGALKTADLKKDKIIVFAPNPSPSAIKEKNLITTIIMAGKGVDQGSILTTGTTKRDGVVVNIDVAPTALAFFRLKSPPEIMGREIVDKPFNGNRLDFLMQSNGLWVAKDQLVAPVLKVFAVWDVLVIFAFMLLLMLPGYRLYARRGRVLLLTVPLIPLSLLLIPTLSSVASMLVGVTVLTAVLVALISWQARESVDPLIVIGFAVIAAVVVDLLTGGQMAARSLIGYSTIAGARFYGIGNEFAGILVGATIMGATALLDRLSPKEGRGRLASVGFISALMFVIALLIGIPILGANFGMLLASLAGFGIAMIGFSRRKIGFRELVFLGVAVLLIIGAVTLYDVSRGVGAESHLGRLVGAVAIQGAAPLLKTVQRKVAMNVSLVQFAFWNWVNVASLIVLLVSAYSLKDLVRQVTSRYKYFKWGLIGGIVGAVAALVFNDSGVVAMAMIFLFLVPGTLYLIASEVQAAEGGS